MVLLSCDEILSQIFQNNLKEKHDEVPANIKEYLDKKAIEIILAGTEVILDWFFWNEAERTAVSDYYRRNNTEYEWHYIDVSDETRRKTST